MFSSIELKVSDDDQQELEDMIEPSFFDYTFKKPMKTDMRKNMGSGANSGIFRSRAHSVISELPLNMVYQNSSHGKMNLKIRCQISVKDHQTKGLESQQ